MKTERLGRIPCIVDGCRRTAAREKHPHATEIICGKHWQIIPRMKRAIYRRACKRYQRRPTEQNDAACWRLWKVMKRHAILGPLA